MGLSSVDEIQHYPNYKPSGVTWLGDIPEHWDLTRLGTRFEERRTKVSDKDYPALSVTKNGTVPQLANAAKTNDGDNRKLVKKGDFVINSRSDRKGSSGIAYQDGSVSLINIVMEPLDIHPIYCNYLLKSYNFIEEFYRMGHGIVADLWTTRYDEMKAIMVGIPPLQEQTAIAQFLDNKTTKIDDAIAIKQQQINLLKERKQILIHKAVTRGVGSSSGVEMKDSGVEWIGKIPEHWEVKPIKYLGNIVNGYAFNSGEFKDEGVRVMKISNIQTMRIDWTDESFIDDKYYQSLPQYRINENDLVFALTRPIISTGIKASIVDTDEKILLNQRNAVLKPFKKLFKKWIYFVILDTLFTQSFDREIDKTGQQPNISTSSIGNIKIPFPCLEEQKEISAYIETASQKIDTAIGLKQQEIEKLKEYKSSLINSVVTGKVKVC
ncbi:restriction endonuclease subunit S [Wenyingzhuangia sp. 1_MG-2023]|nr:restriction endonuclease subunit S [Wenyingzhuangia sp. 1_MG-2023]